MTNDPQEIARFGSRQNWRNVDSEGAPDSTVWRRIDTSAAVDTEEGFFRVGLSHNAREAFIQMSTGDASVMLNVTEQGGYATFSERREGTWFTGDAHHPRGDFRISPGLAHEIRSAAEAAARDGILDSAEIRELGELTGRIFREVQANEGRDRS